MVLFVAPRCDSSAANLARKFIGAGGCDRLAIAADFSVGVIGIDIASLITIKIGLQLGAEKFHPLVTGDVSGSCKTLGALGG